MKAKRTRRASAFGIATAVLLASALYFAPVAHATPVRALSPFGMVSHILGNYSNSQVDRELSLMQGAGVKWLRLEVGWRWAEPSRGVYDEGDTFKRLDYIVAGAKKRGIRVEAVIVEFPNWANGGAGPSTPPTDDATFTEFMQTMAQRYAGRIDYWELGNEVNETEFWNVPRAQSPARYVHFLQAGYRGVKAGNPNAQVISAGLAGSDQRYLQELYDAGAKGSFDLLGVHAYTHERGPYYVTQTDDPGSTFGGLADMKAAMVNNGEPDKKIWITEAGWNTSTAKGSVSSAQQATYIYQAYQRVSREFPYVETLFVYNLRNMGTTRSVASVNYGLLYNDYSPKPAYAQYRRAYYTFGSARPLLTLASSKRSVKRRSRVVLSGMLTRTTGARVAVQIRIRGRWSTVKWLRINSAGLYSLKVAMKKRGKQCFRAMYVGDGESLSTASRTIQVRVR